MAGHTKTLNPRQARLAFAIAVEGRSLSDAAKIANYRSKDSGNLNKLAKTPIVKAEIDRLRAQARATTEITAARFTTELGYQYQRLRDDRPAGDALRALELWGKHLGLLDTKPAGGDVELTARLLALLAQAGRRELPSRARVVDEEGRVIDGGQDDHATG